MTQTASRSGSKLYWGTWGALLVLTAIMLAVDQAPLARALFVAVMVAAMLVKAALIAANFMHLRFERSWLIASVVVGLLGTGALLFVLILADARRIAAMLAAG